MLLYCPAIKTFDNRPVKAAESYGEK